MSKSPTEPPKPHTLDCTGDTLRTSCQHKPLPDCQTASMASGDHASSKQQLSSAKPQDPGSPSDLSNSACPSYSKYDQEIFQQLEELEARLAQEYGMAGPDMDADAVRQETRDRSTSQNDPRYKDYQQLYELYYLRRRMARSAVTDGVSRKTSPQVDGSRFWAVIIGIDKYKGCPLKGCVSDALSIQDYITKDLGVPQDHIHLLLDESATRANIVNTLCGLYSDNRILHGDIIIIYFAGYGSSYPDPGDQDICPDDAIDAICPIDRGNEVDGTVIPDISDREFNSILSAISSVKGHRITVFLDCCFFGAHIRGYPVAGARTMPSLDYESLLDMLHASDKQMSHFPGYHSVLGPDWSLDLNCFVMMVAAQENEYAREVQGRHGFHGVFTNFLLRTLRSDDLPERPTYIDVLLTIPLSYYQIPVIIGSFRRDMRIWSQD